MFSPQPETLQYLNYVTDKFDLRKYMQFGRRVDLIRRQRQLLDNY